MEVRQLEPSDWEIFRTLRLDALRTDPEAFASRVEDWEGLDRDGWQDRMGTVLVAAFDDAVPVGLAGCIRQRPSKMAHRADVVMVWVRPSHRGEKVAETLLEALEVRGRSEGIRQFELAVTVENLVARRFYERIGYVQVGVIPGGFCHAGREINEILMAKQIAGPADTA